MWENLHRVAGVVPAVSLQEAKLHLRVDFTDDDFLIDTLVRTATSVIENRIGGCIQQQSIDLLLDKFPTVVEFGMAPIVSVTSVQYITGDVLTVWASSNYEVDLKLGRLRPVSTSAWPERDDVFNAVQIRFVAGYASEALIPKELTTAVLLLVGHYYANREAVITGTIASELPLGVEALIESHKRGLFGV